MCVCVCECSSNCCTSICCCLCVSRVSRVSMRVSGWGNEWNDLTFSIDLVVVVVDHWLSQQQMHFNDLVGGRDASLLSGSVMQPSRRQQRRRRQLQRRAKAFGERSSTHTHTHAYECDRQSRAPKSAPIKKGKRSNNYKNDSGGGGGDNTAAAAASLPLSPLCLSLSCCFFSMRLLRMRLLFCFAA